MRELIRKIRDELLATEDTVCLERARLVTEAYRRHEGEPAPIKRARAFSHVLHNMSLDLKSNPIFAGNTSSRPRAWMLIPEHGLKGDAQVEIEHEGLKDFLKDKVSQDLEEFWAERSFGGGSAGIGHLAVDLERVVREGLGAVIDEARRYADDGTPEERTYREAMVIALQAVVDWAHRYADEAEAAALSETVPLIRKALLRVAEACRRVPAGPARDLFEGLQAIVLVQLAICIEGHGLSVSVGLPDRVLAPFITDSLDRKSAADLIGAFMLKLAANSLYGRGSKTQAITVGGLDCEGRDRCNDLTMCFLDACDMVRVGDPHLFLRWHEKIDPRFKRRATEMLASGVSMPLLVHDVPTAQGLVSAGIAAEDAWDYCIIGCNELGVPGRCAETATATSGTIQHLATLNQVLLDHPDPDSTRDVPELLGLMAVEYAGKARAARRRNAERKKRASSAVPTPFTSALMRGCVRRGKDMLVGMEYHVSGLYERQLTDATNAVAAIDELVFEERTFSMSELVAAMRRDFAEEAASVRDRLLAARKWGNDDDRVDGFAIELLEMRERALESVDIEFGDPSHIVCHVVRSLHHIDGKGIAASPDGRLAETPVADSVGAKIGTAREGPTAMLNSVLKIDASRYYRGGYNLNLTLSTATASQEVVLALIEAFFGDGGQELQLNVLDAAGLRDAQHNPERYRDLVVRVAGFSARFVDLSLAEQEELIRRAEAVELGR